MSEKNPSHLNEPTLSDAQIKTRDDDPSRRTALAVIGVTTLGAASQVLTGCTVTTQQPQVVAQPQVMVQPQAMVVQGGGQAGPTDSDGGQWADPVGGGRGGLRGMNTGLTDSDSGQISDPIGQGRGHFGRGGATGATDGDSGSWSDPVGNGRGTARLMNTGLTDGDSGSWSDPVGGGRGHR
jgi:hypothetical protein